MRCPVCRAAASLVPHDPRECAISDRGHEHWKCDHCGHEWIDT